MIGLLPASGRAERVNGIPKFAIPTISGESLLARQVRLMRPLVDQVRVCTTGDWAGLVSDLLPCVDLRVIAPSTMNDALQLMADADTDYLIGMPDTYFTGPSPYDFLADIDADIGVACWRCPPSLRGRVGQVSVVDGRIAGMKDKDATCDFPLMWGALRMSRAAIHDLSPLTSHPGLDLPRLLTTHSHRVVQVGGDYIDCGTPAGVRDMLNEENP